MSSFALDKVLFLDLDGCVTSVDDHTYFNADASKYHPSERLVQKVKDFCERTGCKVVISSNWRKFDEDGSYVCSLGTYHNQLPLLRKMLGDCYAGTLPGERRMKKAEAVKKWLDASEHRAAFVVLDDEVREGFSGIAEHGIKDKFVLVDHQHGITDMDMMLAEKILKMQSKEA